MGGTVAGRAAPTAASIFGSVAIATATAAAAADEALRIVPPDDRATFSLSVDNDLFGGTDKFFTSGVLLSYRSPSDLPRGWLDDFADRLDPLVDDNPSRRWEIGRAHV